MKLSMTKKRQLPGRLSQDKMENALLRRGTREPRVLICLIGARECLLGLTRIQVHFVSALRGDSVHAVDTETDGDSDANHILRKLGAHASAHTSELQSHDISYAGVQTC